MQKILLVCDGGHFPQGAFDLVKDKYVDESCLLTGIFLSSVQYSGLLRYSIDVTGGLTTTIMEEEKIMTDRNINLFKSLCEKHGIEYRVHTDMQPDIFPALKKETRFADLMLLSSQLFYSNLAEKQPNSYTKTVLHEAECPVLLVPEDYKQPAKIVLSYDGSEESVYAIKQFAYVFPSWCNLEAQLVYVTDKAEEIPDLADIEEFASRHFPGLTISRLSFNAKEFFSLWMSGDQDAMLVTGSFSRSGISALLKKSFSEEVIELSGVPVFIAHK
ncbi:MAG TPA: hypothetical protein VG738_16925 [Chitinophagaceae bacterium]|nr:hypothetical protein [Chitinophagaceae bacterium]